MSYVPFPFTSNATFPTNQVKNETPSLEYLESLKGCMHCCEYFPPSYFEKGEDICIDCKDEI